MMISKQTQAHNIHNITSIATHTVSESGLDMPDVMDEGRLVAVDDDYFYVATADNGYLGVPFVKKYDRRSYIVTEKHF